jgi:hypothetical protein
MSAVLDSNVVWLSNDFENYSTNNPTPGIPIIAQVKKKQIEYVLAFYTKREFTLIDDDEIYTECINNRQYLKPGYYQLYSNIPIMYPILKWSYF